MPTAADSVVVDASAFVEAYTRSTTGARNRIDGATVRAPHLLLAEIGSTVELVD